MKRLTQTFLVSLFFYIFSQSAHCAEFNDREYKIKAAFIANFIHYTHWKNPPDKYFRFCNTQQRINHVFYKALSNESWFGLQPQFNIISFDKPFKCDVLFVDKLSKNKWLTFLSSNKFNNLLIISESRGSSQLFSHINFFFVDNKLRFEVNPQRVSNSDLSISASLLRLARITSSTEEARND